ncbi:MAG: SMODS domain-containing nucleotidyltransferase [Telluria sp.]
MTTAQLFQEFRNNLTVKNADAISTAYANVTMRLNKDFRDLESDTQYRRQIGSYGRRTAIHGISDLDMAIELPWELYEKYKAYQNNGPSQLLQAVRESLKKRYPKTEIKGDGQVVVIKFSGFVVEVLPAFVDKEADGYRFPDANDGGSCQQRL